MRKGKGIKILFFNKRVKLVVFEHRNQRLWYVAFDKNIIENKSCQKARKNIFSFKINVSSERIYFSITTKFRLCSWQIYSSICEWTYFCQTFEISCMSFRYLCFVMLTFLKKFSQCFCEWKISLDISEVCVIILKENLESFITMLSSSKLSVFSLSDWH